MASLSPFKRHWILNLIERGTSIEETATKMAVLPITVQRVVAGHLGREARRREKPCDRCPGCGGLVNVWPCLECTARRKYPRS